MKPLLHLLVFVTAALAAAAVQRGGWWVAAPFAFVAPPAVELLVGVDTEDRDPRGPRWLLDLPLAVLAAVAEGRPRPGWARAFPPSSPAA